MLLNLFILNYAITVCAFLVLSTGLWVTDGTSDDQMFAIVTWGCLLPIVNLGFLLWMLWCIGDNIWYSRKRVKAKIRDAWVRAKARARDEDNQDTRYL